MATLGEELLALAQRYGVEGPIVGAVIDANTACFEVVDISEGGPALVLGDDGQPVHPHRLRTSEVDVALTASPVGAVRAEA